MCVSMGATAASGDGVGAGGVVGVLDRGVSVEAYLRRWLVHARSRVRVVTYEGYEALVRLHALPSLGHLPLISLRPLDLQDLYGRLTGGAGGAAPLSGGTVLNLHLVLT